MHRVQRAQLHHDEVKNQRPRASGNEEVLRARSSTHNSQGDPLTRGSAADIERCRWGGLRVVAQLVEHRSPKPTVGGSSHSCPASMRKSLIELLKFLKRWILRFVFFVRGRMLSAVVRNAPLVRLYSWRKMSQEENRHAQFTSPIPLLCRCGSHQEPSQVGASEELSVVFVSDHLNNSTGSAILRHSQSLRRMRQVNALTVTECSIFSSEFDRITDSIIVIGKWALRTEMRKRIQQVKTRNNVVLADYVDGVHMPSVDAHINGFICSSYTELMAMRERQQNAWLVPHAIDDRWYDFLGNERERERERESTYLPLRISRCAKQLFVSDRTAKVG